MQCKKTPRFAIVVVHGDVLAANMQERTFPRSTGAGAVVFKTRQEDEVPIHMDAGSAVAAASVRMDVQTPVIPVLVHHVP